MKRLESLLSRKFLFAIVAILCGFYLTVTDSVQPKEFFSFVEIIGATYIIGNVAGSITGGITESITKKFNE